MKRKLSIALIAILALSLTLLTACGGNGGGGGETTKIKMATGGTSGTYYAYGGVVAQALSTAIENVSFDVQSTGASVANIRLVDQGEVDMAMVQNDVMDYAYNGTNLFEDGAVTGFQSMAGVYAEVCQVVARADSGIKSVADLKGKRVSVGDAGSGVEANSRQILEAYGLSFEDITVQNLGFGDSSDALKDNKIDAFFCTAGAPTTAVMELSTTNNITILAIDGDIAEGLKSEYPFYTDYAIPAGTYTGQTEEVKTLAVKATFIVNPSLSEDVVYEMTKALFENKETITEGHAKGEELDPEYAVEGISVEFHPGAVKYFKEIGLM